MLGLLVAAPQRSTGLHSVACLTWHLVENASTAERTLWFSDTTKTRLGSDVPILTNLLVPETFNRFRLFV